MTQITHFGGIGLPVIDLYAPTDAEFDRAQNMIANLPHTQWLSSQQENIANLGFKRLQEAREARKDLMNFMDENHIVPGNKFPMSEEQRVQVAELFGTMRKAATYVNWIAAKLAKPEDRLQIRHVGGTMTNKLHALKAGLGDHAHVHLYGITGDEDKGENLKFLMNRLTEESQIDFEQRPGLKLERIAQNYVILNDAGERTNLQSPVPGVSGKLEGDENDFATFLAPMHTVLIEGSDIGEAKFGRNAFTRFVEAAMATDKQIIFAPPTNVKLVIGNESSVNENRQMFDRIIDHPRTAVLTLNEEEAVAYFLKEKIDPSLGRDLRIHPQLTHALKTIQTRLAEKANSLVPGSIEPLALVSAGAHGAYAITAEQCIHVPVEMLSNPKDTLGAGDGFAAGALIAREEILRRITPHAHVKIIDTDKEILRYSKDDLQGMLAKGQALAGQIVCQKGPQLPPADIAALFGGSEVPRSGIFNAVAMPPSPGRKIS